MKALLVAGAEDELMILSGVLQQAGLAVTSYREPKQALGTLGDGPVELILFTAREDEALSLAREVCAVAIAPLILIVEPLLEDLHVALLDAGADMVLTRPYSSRLLIRWARVLARRGSTVPMASLLELRAKGLRLDPETRTVALPGRGTRQLSNLEFRLLHTLMAHRGQVMPTETIVEHVWGYTGDGDAQLVRGLVRRVRAKVEPDTGDPRYILTVPGGGYIFANDTEEGQGKLARD
jgi:DNA-binding response OmpR family regulator